MLIWGFGMNHQSRPAGMPAVPQHPGEALGGRACAGAELREGDAGGRGRQPDRPRHERVHVPEHPAEVRDARLRQAVRRGAGEGVRVGGGVQVEEHRVDHPLVGRGNPGPSEHGPAAPSRRREFCHSAAAPSP